MSLRPITTTADLAALCTDYADSAYITVDTEFLRERTYWPILCLVQVGRPRREGETDEDFEENGAVLIDPMAKGIDLAPLFALMADRSVLKVFHAARQDIEIFVHLADAVPTPLFDTQIAAMVCGFGDQVGYERLVRSICGQGLDKSSRFTDWSKRPLSDKQLTYALGDVTHLRDVYEHLSGRLEAENRSHWLTEEMAVLEAVETYRVDPAEAWKRLKMRAPTAKLFAAAKGLAEWREAEAQSRDVPRNRVLRDDALMEIAAARPTNHAGLTSGRLSRRENFSNSAAEAMLDVWGCVFLCLGRDERVAFAGDMARHYLVRTRRDDPAAEGLAQFTLTTKAGPYTADAEAALMRDAGIEALVTRDAGGAGAYPKIAGARALGLPVVLIERPVVACAVARDAGEARAWLDSL